ncbi:MAG: NCS2 family permease [Elusimicrobiota bacterium]
MLERIFRIKERGSDLKTEILAGFTTFATMAYILFVNPELLSKGGMSFEGVVLATALSAMIACVTMGIWANLPFALAAGMGYNAFFAFTVCGVMGISWQTALGAVLIDGVIFLIIALLPIRDSIFKGIPMTIKLAASVGIGIFIAFIGLEQSKVIVSNPAVFVGLGNVTSPEVILTIAGIILIAVLAAKRIHGAFLMGIIIITITGMFFKSSGGNAITAMPKDIIALPSFKEFMAILMQIDIKGALAWSMVPVIFTFTFMDIFDTIGSVAGLSSKLGIIDEKGTFPKAGKVLIIDAIGTIEGALCGTTTVTTYIESASGISEGGKTGLTAVVVGILFLAGIFFIPFIKIVPPQATGAVLVIVGFLMMEPILKINFTDVTEALPAFLTIILMPLTYNISYGLIFGMISYTLLKVLTGRRKEVSVVMYIVTIVAAMYFVIGKGM